MPGNTPVRNLPYPLGTDRLMDGDDTIKALATAVENMVQAQALSMTVVTANTAVSVQVTFPVAYSAAPFVLVGMMTAATPAPGSIVQWVSNVTATGFTAWLNMTVTGARTVHYIAVGRV